MSSIEVGDVVLIKSNRNTIRAMLNEKVRKKMDEVGVGHPYALFYEQMPGFAGTVLEKKRIGKELFYVVRVSPIGFYLVHSRDVRYTRKGHASILKANLKLSEA